MILILLALQVPCQLSKENTVVHKTWPHKLRNPWLDIIVVKLFIQEIAYGPLCLAGMKVIYSKFWELQADLYAIALYIHRNPVDMKRPMVTGLELYQWSSYPAYD